MKSRNFFFEINMQHAVLAINNDSHNTNNDKTIATMDDQKLQQQVVNLLFHVHKFFSEEKYSLPFTLETRNSSIPNAGTGLFLVGTVQPGEIVAMYRGVVFSSEEFFLMSTFIGPGNDYLISRRSDKFVIDGNLSGNSLELWNSCVSRFNSKETEISNKTNPYAVGNYINHNKNANVEALDFNFLPTIPPPLQPYIPNVFFTKKDNHGILVKSIVFIAKREITNEEIFLNYMFNPQSKTLPSWYIG